MWANSAQGQINSDRKLKCRIIADIDHFDRFFYNKNPIKIL